MEQFPAPHQNHHENPPPDPVTLMQAALLARHPDWIKENAKEFRALIDAYPEIMEHYQADPEAAIDEIEKIFYH